MTKRLILIIMSVIACAPASRVNEQQSALTASQLIDSLRASGLRVEPRGSIEQPFFSVPGKVYAVDGNDLQVYEYAD